mmetsp:Transcript_10693/g.29724  ORF Transcript_10693/g.29724 Transcript_10693/m.29724 type:complete len:91 (-) Transcript_10693:126-398(-)
MLPLPSFSRNKGQRAQGSGAASHHAARRSEGHSGNRQDSSQPEDTAGVVPVEEDMDEVPGCDADVDALLEKRVHSGYDKDFDDDFDDDDI